MRVKCLAKEHNKMSPARARTSFEFTDHEATRPPSWYYSETWNSSLEVMSLFLLFVFFSEKLSVFPIFTGCNFININVQGSTYAHLSLVMLVSKDSSFFRFTLEFFVNLSLVYHLPFGYKVD